MKISTAILALCASAPVALAQEVDLRIAGDDDDLQGTLEGASVSLGLEADAAPQDYVAAAQADYARMVTGLYTEGYYSGVVSILVDGREAATISPLERPAAIGSVAILVEPGPQFTFGRAEIGPRAPGTELPETFATGETARVEAVRDATRATITGWRDVGHAKAQVDAQEIAAVHPEDRLDVGVAVAPGPRLTFGTVSITGNEAVREDRIRAIAGIPVGAVFSPDELELAGTRLRRTGTFGSVAIVEADAIAAGDRLPITIQVAERAPRRIKFGAEISSLDGLTLSGSWLHRNLLGGAERFEVGAEASGLGGASGGPDYQVFLNFDRPATFGPDADLYIDFDISQRDEEEVFIRQVTLEAGATYIFSDTLTGSAGVGIRAGETRDDLGERRYTLLTLPVSAEWDRRDNPLNAKSGFYLQGEITPFYAIDGTDSGAHLTSDARLYVSPGAEDRLTLAFRAQIGALVGPEIAQAPAEYLFFSGGGGTVRGQEYQSLFIERGDANVGGRGFAAVSAEVRYEVTDNIGVVGFYDMGYLSADPTFENGETHAGAGLGLRYLTGLGPIRVDLATPASGDDAGSKVELYIGIGQAF